MKITKIIYWTSTVLVALSLAMAAVKYLGHDPELIKGMSSLGFSVHFVNLLGIAKILGAIALIVPAFPKIKEWAYAGCYFTFIGAVWMHWAVAGAATITAPVIMLLILTVSYISWNKLQSAKSKSIF